MALLELTKFLITAASVKTNSNSNVANTPTTSNIEIGTFLKGSNNIYTDNSKSADSINITLKEYDERIAYMQNLRSDYKSTEQYKTFEQNINNSEAAINSYSKQITSQQGIVLNLETLLAQENLKNPKDENKISNLKQQIEQAKQQLQELEKQRNISVAQKEFNTKVLEQYEKNVAVWIDSTIQQLESEKNTIQEKINNQTLDEADGNWFQRQSNGSKGQLRSSINSFRKLKEEYENFPNESTKQKLIATAHIIKLQYQNVDNNNKFTPALNIINSWLEKNA